MLEKYKILAVIPARGGSKGIPGKNLRQVGGKPLLAWTIEEAGKSRLIDRLVLSSEDEEIIRVGRSYGVEVPFVRPAELATDEVPASEAVLHAVESLPGYDYVVMLQPSVPLRRTEDIDGCILACHARGASSCLTVTAVDKSPYWMYSLDRDLRLIPILTPPGGRIQRQDLPPVYVLNGAVYVARTGWIIRERAFMGDGTIAWVMPRERSLDIDSERDLEYLEFLLSSNSRG